MPCDKLLIDLECSVFTVLTEILQGQYSKTTDNSRVIGRVIGIGDFWNHWSIWHKPEDIDRDFSPIIKISKKEPVLNNSTINHAKLKAYWQILA